MEVSSQIEYFAKQSSMNSERDGDVQTLLSVSVIAGAVGIILIVTTVTLQMAYFLRNTIPKNVLKTIRGSAFTLKPKRLLKKNKKKTGKKNKRRQPVENEEEGGAAAIPLVNMRVPVEDSYGMDPEDWVDDDDEDEILVAGTPKRQGMGWGVALKK